MEDLIKIVKSLEYSDLLLKGVTEIVQNGGGFLSMLLRTLGARLLENLLTVNKKGKGIIRAGEGIVRTSYGHRSCKNNNKTNF